MITLLDERIPKTIRVLIIDDHQMVAESLAFVLEHDAAFQVVGTAGTVAEGVRLILDIKPDVILVDYHLGDGTAVDVARALPEHGEHIPLLVISGQETDEAFLDAVAAGACGFLSKTQPAAEILQAVRRAADGEMLIPAATLARLVGMQRESEKERAASELLEPLTPRELEILILLAEGLDNRLMADRLSVSYATVRCHVQTILGKLDVHSRLEAVARARQRGLLK